MSGSTHFTRGSSSAANTRNNELPNNLPTANQVSDFEGAIKALKTISTRHGNTTIKKHETLFKKCLNLIDFHVVDLINANNNLKLSNNGSDASKHLEEENAILKSQLAAVQLENAAVKDQNAILNQQTVELHGENGQLKTLIAERDFELIKVKAARFDDIMSFREKSQTQLQHPEVLLPNNNTPTTSNTNLPYLNAVRKQSPGIISPAALTAFQAGKDCNEEEHVVIITPHESNKAKSSSTTFQQLEEKLGTKTMRDKKIRMKGKTFLSNKRVAVHCSAPEDCEAIRAHLNADEHLTAELPKPKNPAINIPGIHRDIANADELIDTILELNAGLSHLDKSMFDVKVFRVDRTGHTKFAIIVVDPEAFKLLMKMEKVFLGFGRCPVSARCDVVQCDKCNAFGHKGSACAEKEENILCAHCASPAHTTDRCHASPENHKCSNCLRENFKRRNRNRNEPVLPVKHSATDLHQCPSFQWVHQNLMRKFPHVSFN